MLSLQVKDLLKVMSQVDIDVLEKITDLLKPFKDATTIMSSETSSSVSLIRPLTHSLMTKIKPDPANEDPTVIHTAKATLYHDLEMRLAFS